MYGSAENLSNTTGTLSSSAYKKEAMDRRKEVMINNDILHDIAAFITRVELGQNFSLVNNRFYTLAYRKMHIANEHWVEGECHLIASATKKTTMVVPRGDNGGFEVVPVPSSPLTPNVLGFRGTIHFNGILTDDAIAFFRHALPPTTTLYRFSLLDEFYRVNALLSPFQTSERLNIFLDNCMHLVELGGDDAFVSAFLALPLVHGRVRKLRATRFRELFLGWLQQHQRDGEWRQLQIMRRVPHEERNRLIKLIFQNLNNYVMPPSSVDDTVPQQPIRFCIRLVVSNWGEMVERLPLRWLRNSRNGQCVVLVERRPVDNMRVELCIVRCPYAEAEQRGLMDNAVTMDDLEAQFGWEEPICTVDVMHMHRHDNTDDVPPVNIAVATPLHYFF